MPRTQPLNQPLTSKPTLFNYNLLCIRFLKTVTGVAIFMYGPILGSLGSS